MVARCGTVCLPGRAGRHPRKTGNGQGGDHPAPLREKGWIPTDPGERTQISMTPGSATGASAAERKLGGHLAFGPHHRSVSGRSFSK